MEERQATLKTFFPEDLKRLKNSAIIVEMDYNDFEFDSAMKKWVEILDNAEAFDNIEAVSLIFLSSSQKVKTIEKLTEAQKLNIIKQLAQGLTLEEIIQEVKDALE